MLLYFPIFETETEGTLSLQESSRSAFLCGFSSYSEAIRYLERRGYERLLENEPDEPRGFRNKKHRTEYARLLPGGTPTEGTWNDKRFEDDL